MIALALAALLGQPLPVVPVRETHPSPRPRTEQTSPREEHRRRASRRREDRERDLDQPDRAQSEPDYRDVFTVPD